MLDAFSRGNRRYFHFDSRSMSISISFLLFFLSSFFFLTRLKNLKNRTLSEMQINVAYEKLWRIIEILYVNIVILLLSPFYNLCWIYFVTLNILISDEKKKRKKKNTIVNFPYGINIATLNQSYLACKHASNNYKRTLNSAHYTKTYNSRSMIIFKFAPSSQKKKKNLARLKFLRVNSST